ncbi:MAG: tetratricopeptide repeat protein [Nitrospirae bacterium]|nr:tetratricopeptide repeat protein [Nitrospirota bacterium]
MIFIFFSFYPAFLFGQTPPDLPVVTPSDTPADKDPTQKGTEYLSQGKLDAALEEFKKALIKNPNNHRAYFGLGRVYLQKQLIDQSEKALRSAISIQPDYAPAYQFLGEVFELKNDLPNAILNYQKTVSLENVNKAFASFVATAKFRLTQIGETPEKAQKIKDHLSKGSAYLKKKEREKALMEYQSVIDLAPDQMEALENAGTLLFELARYEASEKYLQKIISINPGLLFAHLLLGEAYEAEERVGEAWEEYQTILQRGQKTPQFREVIEARKKMEQSGQTKEIALEIVSRLKKAASLFEIEKKLDAAELEYRGILKSVPENIKAKFGLGVILFQKERLPEARKLFLDVVAKEPSLVPGHLFLGQIYLKEKEVQKAFNEFSRVKELIHQLGNPEEFKEELAKAERELAQFGDDSARTLEIQLLLDEGGAFLKSENIDAAREKFIQALSLSPKNLQALDSLGKIYLRETSLDLEKAGDYSKQILALYPELPSPRIDLALIYQSQEKYEKAIVLLEEVIQMDQKESEWSRRAKYFLSQMGGSPEKARALFSYIRSGNQLFKEEKWSEAKEAYQKALGLVPEQVQALYALALVEIKQKNPVEAQKDLEALLKINPDYLEARFQSGLLLGAVGKYTESIEEMKKVILLGKEGKLVQTAKKEMEGLEQKAESEAHFKSGNEAMQTLEQLEKENPPEEGVPVSRDKKNMLQKAVAEFEAAIRLNRDNAYYYYNLGFAYIRNFDLVSGEYALKRAIELKPDLFAAHYRLAILYDLAGAYKSAFSEYEQVIALGKPEEEEVREAVKKLDEIRPKLTRTEEAKGYSIVGALLMQRKEYPTAGRLLLKATELVPWEGDTWYDLGNYYEAVEDDDRAADAYQKAIEKSPNFSSPYFYLGIIQERRGDFHGAYENFKKGAKYLVNKKSKEGVLLQARLDYYQQRVSGNVSATLFGSDSNAGNSEAFESSEVYSVYALSLKYSFYKSLKVILSGGLSVSNSVYYDNQRLFNGESVSFEARWPDLNGLTVVLSPSMGMSYQAGGFAGWNSQFGADIQTKGNWFDSITTHLGYAYSVSAINPFYNSIQQAVSWSVFKSLQSYGGLSWVMSAANRDVVASDDSQISWNAGVTYNRKFLDYYNGSLSIAYGQVLYKNPDPAALQAGLGALYRKNQSVSLNAGVTWFFYSNVTLTASAGWQSVASNLSALVSRNVNDVLSEQTAPIGGYKKHTLGLTVNYSF